jgi:phosphatidylinositol alpha-1,6-mannosyltransferase
VVFPGRVADADLPAMYRHASLFVLVSRRYEGAGEGLPLTPIEAAACGVPIAVSDADGSREAVRHGETGFLLESADPDTITGVLLEASRDRARLTAMGARAAEDARARFGLDRFVREHRAFVERIDSTRRPS